MSPPIDGMASDKLSQSPPGEQCHSHTLHLPLQPLPLLLLSFFFKKSASDKPSAFCCLLTYQLHLSHQLNGPQILSCHCNYIFDIRLNFKLNKVYSSHNISIICCVWGMLQTDRVENDKLSWEHKEFLFHTTVIFVSIVVQYEGISPCLDNYVLLSTLVFCTVYYRASS